MKDIGCFFRVLAFWLVISVILAFIYAVYSVMLLSY